MIVTDVPFQIGGLFTEVDKVEVNGELWFLLEPVIPSNILLKGAAEVTYNGTKYFFCKSSNKNKNDVAHLLSILDDRLVKGRQSSSSSIITSKEIIIQRSCEEGEYHTLEYNL